MESKATLSNIQISPRKVRLVAGLIRGASIEDARQQLTFCQKRVAKPMLKLLNSAVANAINNHNIEESTLRIKAITVNHGRTLKRYRPRAFGRATMLRKRASHINLVLEGEGSKKKAVPKESIKEEKKESKKIDEKDMEKQPPKTKQPDVDTGSHGPTVDDVHRKGHERPSQHKKDNKGLVKV